MNIDFSQIDRTAEYEFRGLHEDGRTIKAIFRRTSSGIKGALKGMFGADQVLHLEENECFAIQKSWREVNPYTDVASENAFIFFARGREVQERKKKLGIPLDGEDKG